MENVNILLDDSHGIYIPKLFIETMKDEYLQGITEDQKKDLSDPYNEWYWETWEELVNDYQIVLDGNIYTLHHDGDLFLICYELMTDEEKENFFYFLG